MSFDGSKQVTIGTNFVEKNFKISQRQESFIISQIIGSKSCFSNVSCWAGRSENLTCLSESPWNEDAKIGIGLISISNTSRENQQNVFTKKACIHWYVANCTFHYSGEFFFN